jgi:hypothetical protein
MSKKQKRVFWPTLVILSIGVCAFVFAHTRGAKPTSKADGPPGSTVKAQDPTNFPVTATSGPVQMVRFTVYDSGIFPAEAHAKAGVVAIFIEDVTGNSRGLMVQGEHGPALPSIARGVGKWRGSAQASLTPGRYRVFELGHANHKATLIVEQ